MNAVEFRFQCLRVFRPFIQYAIQANDRMELRVGASAFLPERRLLGIERIVRHYHFADAGQLEYAADVGAQLLIREKFTRLPEIGGLGVQAEGLQNRHHAAPRLRHRRVLQEQCSPDQVRLFPFRERPVFGRLHAREPEKLGFQIVIRISSSMPHNPSLPSDGINKWV